MKQAHMTLVRSNKAHNKYKLKGISHSTKSSFLLRAKYKRSDWIIRQNEAQQANPTGETSG